MYSGRIKSYNPKQGYGFLDCPDAHTAFGRDVFIHKAQMGELLGRFVGPGTKLEPKALKMNVQFSVEINKAGMPQARDVSRFEDLAGQNLLEASVITEVELDELELQQEPSPATFTGQDLMSSERVGEEEEIPKKGYQGRGGTIRIPSKVEECDEGLLSLSSLQAPSLTRTISGGSGGRKAGRSSGGATKQGIRTSANMHAQVPLGGEVMSEVQAENCENAEEEVVAGGRKAGKKGTHKQSKIGGGLSLPVESKRRGYKDPYIRKQPQFPYESGNAQMYQTNGPSPPSPPFGQVNSAQQQSQSMSPMGASSFGSPTPSTPYGVQDTQSVCPIFQMPAAMLPYPQQIPQMYCSSMQTFGQHVQQLQSFQQSVPMSPQTSYSSYAPSSSSPPHTPLHLATMSDGSGSPVAMALPAAPSFPGMPVPVNGVPQGMTLVLAVASGPDALCQATMMPADVPPGSPVVHSASFQATRFDDSDSDCGYRPPMPAEALPVCGTTH